VEAVPFGTGFEGDALGWFVDKRFVWAEDEGIRAAVDGPAVRAEFTIALSRLVIV